MLPGLLEDRSSRTGVVDQVDLDPKSRMSRTLALCRRAEQSMQSIEVLSLKLRRALFGRSPIVKTMPRCVVHVEQTEHGTIDLGEPRRKIQCDGARRRKVDRCDHGLQRSACLLVNEQHRAGRLAHALHRNVTAAHARATLAIDPEDEDGSGDRPAARRDRVRCVAHRNVQREWERRRRSTRVCGDECLKLGRRTFHELRRDLLGGAAEGDCELKHDIMLHDVLDVQRCAALCGQVPRVRQRRRGTGRKIDADDDRGERGHWGVNRGSATECPIDAIARACGRLTVPKLTGLRRVTVEDVRHPCSDRTRWHTDSTVDRHRAIEAPPVPNTADDPITMNPRSSAPTTGSTPEFVDLGRIDYESALAIQRAALEAAIRARGATVEGDEHRGETERTGGRDGVERLAWPERIHLLEHDPPVITVTRRPDAARHVLADSARLAALGVELRETDRGGDVTYHGPGQLVVYPILDLNALGLRIHGYMRLLEEVVIRTLAIFGLHGERDPTATGVWIVRSGERVEAQTEAQTETQTKAKICAMGVRVSRWVSMHGLALNVDCDLSHFDLIVPCGLAGRAVTSMRRELGASAPTMGAVKTALREEFLRALADAPSFERLSRSAQAP